jgi:hypothetical protein
MNLAELERRLLAAARLHQPSDHVPYGFEQRVRAHCSARPTLDRWAWWAGVLWRASAPCLAIVLFLSAWAWVAGAPNGANDSLDNDLEGAVYAVVDSTTESW